MELKFKSINKLEPALFPKIWGGARLSKLKNQDDNIGESWEISKHPEGPSRIGTQSLLDLTQLNTFNYLVKLIDTADNLSIQVHPDDDYAHKFEQSKGKTECWLILDSNPGAGIYLGMRKGVSKQDFESKLRSNQNINELLNFYETHKGDFFFVPAGTIHAIGSGVFLCEVQQSSGITYRVWDWNRLENNLPRTLHIKQAMEVIRFEEELNSADNFLIKKRVWEKKNELLISHNDFEVRFFSFTDEVIIDASPRQMNGMICLSGEGNITCDNESQDLSLYDSFLLKSGKRYKMKATTKLGCKILWVG